MIWRDHLTGMKVELSEDRIGRTRSYLAEKLAERLREHNDPKSAADEAARFWKDYYGVVFPLRFGLGFDEEGLIDGVKLDLTGSEQFRERFLDGMRLPPLLPPRNPSHESELISDRSLQQAIVVNLNLRAVGSPPERINLARLAALTSELADVEPLSSLLRSHFPSLEKHSRVDVNDRTPIHLMVCAAQRIKSYIFETPGLNEIRGASTLLDELTEEFAEEIGDRMGPELVLRQAASTVEFLIHDPEGWADRYKRLMYGRLGTGIFAVGSARIELRDLIERFNDSVREAYVSLNRDRLLSQIPLLQTLPFEERCELCRRRPAEGWYKLEGRFHPACRPCMTKLERGREERREKLGYLLEWLGMEDDPSPLGIKPRREYTPRTLQEMIPRGKVRRSLIGVIYGDGNNFGAILQRHSSISDAIQWSNRVERTIKAATALAVARSCQEGAMSLNDGWRPGSPPPLEKFPFQILALGGDDLSLICWGRVAPRFCERFVALTDMELSPGASFSLGGLVCDDKTPIQIAVEFSESGLMKWAKKAWRGSEGGGTIALMLADSPEKVPSDLKSYLERMFIKRGRVGEMCMTLRPLRAEELRFLLEKSRRMSIPHRGRLYRTMQSFLEASPLAAMLYYVYQRGRGGKEFFEELESAERSGSWRKIFGFRYLPAHKLHRRPFGESDREEAIFCPLWDLVEIMKMLE